MLKIENFAPDSVFLWDTGLGDTRQQEHESWFSLDCENKEGSMKRISRKLTCGMESALPTADEEKNWKEEVNAARVRA